MATPFGVVMAGKETAAHSRPALGEHEVKLAFSLGEWVAQVAKVRACPAGAFRVSGPPMLSEHLDDIAGQADAALAQMQGVVDCDTV